MRPVTDGTHRGGYPAHSPWQAHIGGAVGLISGSWSRAPSGKRRGDLDFPLLCHASDAAPQLSNYAN